MRKLIGVAAAFSFAMGAVAWAQTETAKPSVAVVCKAGGKMFARVISGGPVVVRFTPATAAAKDTPPGDGQCAFKDQPMGDKAPIALRARTPEIGRFLVDNLLNKETFEVQAFDNGKGILIITATGPAPAQ